MAKYDTQLSELKNRLPGAQNVLIALPSDANLDETASGAALFLALQSHGKQVQIASDKLPQVSQANIYGTGSIKNTITPPVGGGAVAQAPTPAGGDYTLVLEGVASPQGTVPSLEKLDWYAENNNLNLVFHTLPGQVFQPGNIYPKQAGTPAAGGSGNFDVVFVIGAPNLNALGNVYAQNQQLFSGTHLVNVDKDTANQNFGQTNVIDGSSSSVSEILTDVIPSLGLPFDRDIATNLLAGIFDMTGNLAGGGVGPDTYVAVGNCLRVGGQKPLSGGQPVSAPQVGGFQNPTPIQSGPIAQPTQPAQPMMDFSAFMQPPASATVAQPVDLPQPVPTFQEIFNQQSKPEETFTVPPIAAVLPNEVTPQPAPQLQNTYQPSPEERPAGERVITDSPEPGWLTPKVFKGTSVG